MIKIKHNKHKVDLVLVVPIGPGSNPEYVIDTITSFKFYTRSTHKIILLDDSQEQISEKIQKIIHDCDVLYTPRPLGGWAGLYINLSNAYQHALDHYDFTVLLKMDTDALIIGAEPEKHAISLFESNPFAGMAGQYPYAYNGELWNIRWPEQRIVNSTRSWKFFDARLLI